jgi:hypothetical protein
MDLKTFKYSNVQHKIHGGSKMTHKVHIKNGKGYKSVTHVKHGKRLHHSRKALSTVEMGLIKIGKFIPGLFNDLNKKSKTRKR